VCELQRRGQLAGPVPLIFDIARIDRPSSHRYTASSLRQLVEQLQLPESALRRGIQRANALRGHFGDLRRERIAPGSRYERLVRASLFADVGPLMSAWEPANSGSARGRVVLAGSSPPDDRIHELIEACGWHVAAELCDRNLERLGGPVEAAGSDPVQAIAQGWLRQVFLGRDTKVEERLRTVLHEARADAAVLWFARDDEALAWQVPRLRRVLEGSGVPHVVLTAADWALDEEAAGRIRTFLDGLSA